MYIKNCLCGLECKDWFVSNDYSEGPCIFVQSYATNELEHTHAAAAQQKDAVWRSDR